MKEQKQEQDIVCNSCGYSGLINTYDPCLSVYNDCRCPKCGSTDNEHNDKYRKDIFDAINKTVT